LAWRADIWDRPGPARPEASAQDAPSGGPFARFLAALRGQGGRWGLWLPVAFAGGIVAYFALPREPPWEAVAVLAVAALWLTALAARKGRVSLSLIVAFALFGAVVAKVRTETVSTRMLSAPASVTLTGRVERVEGREGSAQRLTVAVGSIEGIRKGVRPDLVRLTVRGAETGSLPGDHIRVRARLLPPPEPVMPGAYDFARAAWFDGLGATGFSYGAPEQIAGPPAGLSARFAAWLARARIAIAERVYAVLPGRAGTFAVALMTGERADLPDDVVEDLRISGLAHLLAISGLHMMLVAGGVFWGVRALLALSPALAGAWPIKKWAAGTALAAAAVYLALSGAGIATQRAFIMVVIMFAAILLDRTAITMRNVALAALAILLVQPESVLSASFQMSFMAVAGLVAFYEAVRDWRAGRDRDHGGGTVHQALRGTGLYAAGVVVTTLVAGAATAPVAAWHFQRVAAYSLLANAAALPLVSLLVMPSLLLALLLMPFGLEVWPLKVAGWGLDAVIAVAHRVSSLDGASRIVPAAPGLALVLAVFGMLWLCLWRGWVRALGLVAVLLAVPLAAARVPPDVLIEREGRNVAIRNGDGELAVMTARAGRYSAERWLRADGDAATVADAARRPGFSCDRFACIAQLERGRELAVVTHPAALDEECARADIVIATFKLRRDCPSAGAAIDIWALRDNGAHAIYLEEEGLRVERANDHRGLRPWVSVSR